MPLILQTPCQIKMMLKKWEKETLPEQGLKVLKYGFNLNHLLKAILSDQDKDSSAERLTGRDRIRISFSFNGSKL
jgi:hypothetical protein